jgi:hypothetical protein
MATSNQQKNSQRAPSLISDLLNMTLLSTSPMARHTYVDALSRLFRTYDLPTRQLDSSDTADKITGPVTAGTLATLSDQLHKARSSKSPWTSWPS